MRDKKETRMEEKTKRLIWGRIYGVKLDGNEINKAKMPFGMVRLDSGFAPGVDEFIKKMGIKINVNWDRDCAYPFSADVTKKQFMEIITKHHELQQEIEKNYNENFDYDHWKNYCCDNEMI